MWSYVSKGSLWWPCCQQRQWGQNGRRGAVRRLFPWLDERCGGSGQCGSRGAGGKWWDSECILKVEPTGLPEGLAVRCKRKRGSMMTPRFCSKQLEGWSYHQWNQENWVEKVWEVKSGDQTWTYELWAVELTIGHARVVCRGEDLAGAMYSGTIITDKVFQVARLNEIDKWIERENQRTNYWA